MKTLFLELSKCIKQGEDTVLVSIIAEKGSAPRGCGAQMLVSLRGRLQGTVGGGSLEMKAVELAQGLLRSDAFSADAPLVHEFLLREHQEATAGMICGGDVTMLFQPVPASDALWCSVTELIAEQIEKKQPGWLVIHTKNGAPSLLGGNGQTLAGVSPEQTECLSGKRGAMVGELFSVPLPIGERAVIFGCGHCACALAPMLKSVGFRVFLVDCRPELAKKERFPDAEQVICCDYEKLDEHLNLKEEDFVVIMTHTHATDALVQEWVLRQRTSYVGALGSRRKIAFINEILREKNIPEEAIGSVHSPIGISIKAATPEEIAVSITAEMIYERAVLREHAGNASGAH